MGMPETRRRRALLVACCTVMLCSGVASCGHDRARGANGTSTSNVARGGDSGAGGGAMRRTPERDTDAAVPDTGAMAPDSGSAAAAVAVVRDYYAAIDARDYRRAYRAWEQEGAASGQSFDAFRHGFDSTRSVAVQLGTPSRIEGAAGSRYVTVPVQVTARTAGGAVQHFAGTYTLRRAVVTGATPEQRTWHIYSAKVTSVKVTSR